MQSTNIGQQAYFGNGVPNQVQTDSYQWPPYAPHTPMTGGGTSGPNYGQNVLPYSYSQTAIMSGPPRHYGPQYGIPVTNNPFPMTSGPRLIRPLNEEYNLTNSYVNPPLYSHVINAQTLLPMNDQPQWPQQSAETFSYPQQSNYLGVNIQPQTQGSTSYNQKRNKNPLKITNPISHEQINPLPPTSQLNSTISETVKPNAANDDKCKTDQILDIKNHENLQSNNQCTEDNCLVMNDTTTKSGDQSADACGAQQTTKSSAIPIIDPHSRKPIEMPSAGKSTQKSVNKSIEIRADNQWPNSNENIDQVKKQAVCSEFLLKVLEAAKQDKSNSPGKDMDSTKSSQLLKQDDPNNKINTQTVSSEITPSKPISSTENLETNTVTDTNAPAQLDNEQNVNCELDQPNKPEPQVDDFSPSDDATENSVPQNPSSDNQSEVQKSETKRLAYSREALFSKRDVPSAQNAPFKLKKIEGVTFVNDTDAKFVGLVKSILNKITPETYDKLLIQLNELSVLTVERLSAMIDTIFSKAIDEKVFCPLYAKICLHFQHYKITVNENGKVETFQFRQILLARCQKCFHSDYRDSINYDQRLSKLGEIKDEKVHKETSEQLEEDLHKAKRRHLGNIHFIGELFKLRMLIDIIMFDCIESLLSDKTDEENLECLCKLLNTIGEQLDMKTDKPQNQLKLDKCFQDLATIANQELVSTRIRFMIQDVLDLRKNNWIPRRTEAKPTTISEIHEEERLRGEKEEYARELERQKRRQAYRGSESNPPLYIKSHGSGSRGSGIKTQTNKIALNSVMQLKISDQNKRGQELSFSPHGGSWSRKPHPDNKSDNYRSNTGGSNQSINSHSKQAPSIPGYRMTTRPYQESTRTINSANNQRGLEPREQNDLNSRKIHSNNISTDNSPSCSRTSSRERNTNAPPSNNSTDISPYTTDTEASTKNVLSDTSLDEEKVEARARSLVDEYLENYREGDQRPIKDALDDLGDFCTSNTNLQALTIQTVLINAVDGKPRDHKAIGYLIDAAIRENITSQDAFLTGFKLFVQIVPDLIVDIPLIWTNIGTILSVIVFNPLADALLLERIFKLVSSDKSEELFHCITQCSVEIFSESCVQKHWQSAGYSLDNLFPSRKLSQGFIDSYSWLSKTSIRENFAKQPDQNLVKLFKSLNEKDQILPNEYIKKYIDTTMDQNHPHFIRNIVLSYLTACLINSDSNYKVQEMISKERIPVLNTYIGENIQNQIEAIYAVQNFVHKFEYPSGMAQLFLELFYDEDTVSEEALYEWRDKPDPSEIEGHSIVVVSAKNFFTWLEKEDDGE